MSENKPICDMLADYMKRHRWSTRKLAKKLGLSAATLNRVVRTGKMDAGTMLVIIDFIFGDTP